MPITVGEFNDVPAAGSNIASAYHQRVAGRVTHRFATVAERDSKWPAATADKGAQCFVTGINTHYLCDGTGWIVVYEPPQTWTPNLAGVFIGTGGTAVGVYQRSLTWLSCEGTVTFGTGFTIPVGGMQLNLPKLAASMRPGQLTVDFNDVSGFRYPGSHSSSTTVITLTALNSSGAHLNTNAAPITASLPFNWVAGDSVSFGGRYRISAYS